MKIWQWVIVVILVLAGISTVLPTGASKDCYLGYEAHCTFTPISTIMCIGIAAALVFFFNMKNEKKEKEEEAKGVEKEDKPKKKGKKGKKK